MLTGAMRLHDARTGEVLPTDITRNWIAGINFNQRPCAGLQSSGLPSRLLNCSRCRTKEPRLTEEVHFATRLSSSLQRACSGEDTRKRRRSTVVDSPVIWEGLLEMARKYLASFCSSSRLVCTVRPTACKPYCVELRTHATYTVIHRQSGTQSKSRRVQQLKKSLSNSSSHLQTQSEGSQLVGIKR